MDATDDNTRPPPTHRQTDSSGGACLFACFLACLLEHARRLSEMKTTHKQKEEKRRRGRLEEEEEKLCKLLSPATKKHPTKKCNWYRYDVSPKTGDPATRDCCHSVSGVIEGEEEAVIWGAGWLSLRVAGHVRRSGCTPGQPLICSAARHS